MLLIVFVLSMFLSSALLFLVEPMIARMLLPSLGGTPSVWNTCLVFFQATLLAGYLYAHASSRWLARRPQILLHLAFILLPFALVGLLPIHLPAGWEPPAASSPVFWVLATLAVSVGLPFFILSSTAPMLQRWFSDSGHPDAADPYFLYAASNAGSLAGLLAYPLLVEPLLTLRSQSQFWSAGYALFVLATALCALSLWSKARTSALSPADRPAEPAPAIAPAQRLRWIALAFVPSSLVLGVTTALTTDVPAIPLLWVLTLAVYLLSFILVFARRPPISHEWMVRRLPFLILIALAPILSQTKFSFPLMLAVELLVLFGVAMVCHGELARSRPPAARLTEFYLWISIGGVLGGIFNALIAPIVFRSVFELPLVLILAAALRTPPPAAAKGSPVWARRNDWLLPAALFLVMLAVILVLARLGIRPGRSLNIIVFGYSLLWCLSFARRRLRFILGLIALLAASSFYGGPFGRVLHTERSFFGVSRVTTDARQRFHFLFHGGTTHGIEYLDPARSREPLSYFTRTGPASQIFQAAQSANPQGNWAIVGLGAGAMACYLQPGQSLTYYEIDPVVVRIATNPQYFRFLSQCAPQAHIELGDARLKLRSAPDAGYNLLVLDAFSGDSIPMHLVTREALALYQRKLAPHGLLAFHISNLYLDLAPILGALARDAHLVCLIENDTAISQAEIDAGKYPSTWVVMARSADDLSVLTWEPAAPARWTPIPQRPNQRVWTDDYSNLLTAIRWNW
jgi:hypothetical protein